MCLADAGIGELSFDTSAMGRGGRLRKAALVNKGGLGNDAEDKEEGNGGKTLGHQHVFLSFRF